MKPPNLKIMQTMIEEAEKGNEFAIDFLRQLMEKAAKVMPSRCLVELSQRMLNFNIQELDLYESRN